LIDVDPIEDSSCIAYAGGSANRVNIKLWSIARKCVNGQEGYTSIQNEGSEEFREFSPLSGLSEFFSFFLI
jgi:hypothetical protein